MKEHDPLAAAIFAAILEDPADDMPRLAYADWLCDNGDEAHSEFIYRQIKGSGAQLNPSDFWGWFFSWASWNKLSPGTPKVLINYCGKDLWCQVGKFPRHDASNNIHLLICRGFVEKIYLPAGLCWTRLPLLVKEQPLTRVEIPGVIRQWSDGSWAVWRGTSENDVPSEVWLHIPEASHCNDRSHYGAGTHCHWRNYPTAQQCLSDGLLAWAKQWQPPKIKYASSLDEARKKGTVVQEEHPS